jgi:hypothetical protein
MPELDDLPMQEISQLVFQDDRWQTAQQQLQMRALSRDQALKMLQEGAEMYGLPGADDAGLVLQRCSKL